MGQQSGRRAAGSWLSGPRVDDIATRDNEYPGQDLGLPEHGPGSLASGWRRCCGLLLDWLMAYALAFLFVGNASTFEAKINAAALPQLGIWFAIGVVSITLFGFTPGQFAAGLRVIRVDLGVDENARMRAAVGIGRALVRQVLIVVIVPALINDNNGRALHDRITRTAVVRSR
ncbi:RDD family protein [Gordonia sp. X0973]|uniref:RDD family protein n=1 Tax=Gordonia sp. X0973 TaxID=2742602 RepID=UPI000F54108D|nr:RDD family protein [Gordonia sp. X0973]QKT07636.1 RDD family protein [Gordonia sp. X0973]